MSAAEHLRPPVSMPAFHVLIPARRASTRLPDKALADIGGIPMVVRVGRRAHASGAASVTVATDDARIVAVCVEHGIQAVLTDAAHASGTDRIAEAAAALDLPTDAVVVNVQGDEPFIDPELIRACAAQLHRDPDAAIATAAHPITDATEVFDPNVVKVVLDAHGNALMFSRAPIPWRRDAFAGPDPRAGAMPALPDTPPFLRHVGIYAFRIHALQDFARLAPCPLEQAEALEQLRALWHGWRLAVLVLGHAPAGGVDTPRDLERARALVAGTGGD